MLMLPPRGPERIESSNARCAGVSLSSARTATRGGGIFLAGIFFADIFFAGFFAGIRLPLCDGLFRQSSYTYTLFHCDGSHERGASLESLSLDDIKALADIPPPAPLCFLL